MVQISIKNNNPRNKDDREVHARYLPTVEIKGYNVTIDGQNFFNQPVRNNFRTFDNIWKNKTGLGDYYTTGCLLDCNHFSNYHKMIAIDLGKQQALDADPKAIQKVNFTGNLARHPVANTTIFFIIEEVKEIILDFSQGTVKVL